MKLLLAGPALAFATLLSLAPAAAQTQPNPPGTITMDQARRLASENGMMRVEEIELDDGVWEVEGRDNAGAEIQVDIRANDGAIIKVERDRATTAETMTPK